MEEKINIAKILKNKPQGTKLYDLLYNVDVELDTISTTDTETVVWCTNETDNNTTCHRGYSEFGTLRGCPDGLQILLPSKEMRDWHKFNWKKGDVLISVDKRYEIIFDKFVDDTYMSIVGKHCMLDEGYCGTTYIGAKTFRSDYFELQTEDTAKALYCAIEAKLGGKINRQTLEVEKPHPEFKDGDAEKKEVTDLKPKVELKPFDRVLVRDSKSDNWRANLFGYIGKDGYYHCVYANWAYCIPYIGNESLLGTTKDVEG